MASKVTRDHHTWTRDTIKNVSGDVTLDLAGDLTIDVAGGQMTVTDNTATDPDLIIESTDDSSSAGNLTFLKDRDGSGTTTGQDGDSLGFIKFSGFDDAPGEHLFGQIKGNIVDATNGLEKGSLTFSVITEASIVNGHQTGLLITGTSTNDEVDVTIANGAASMTTIAGDLDIDGDTISTAGSITLDSAGDITLDADGEDVHFHDGGTAYGKLSNVAGSGFLALYYMADPSYYGFITTAANGVTSIATAGGSTAHLNLSPAGELNLQPTEGMINIPATDILFFDGGSHTYIRETSNDVFDITVGGLNMMKFTEDATDKVEVLGSNLEIDAAKKLYLDGGSDTYIQESSDDVLDFYVGTDKMLVLDEAADKITMGATNWVAGTVSGATITEFSAANSAYAGMILGCTHVFGSGTGGAFVSVSTSWENLLWDTDKFALVTFVVPPSNRVKISVHLPFVAAASYEVRLGLATDSSATTLNTKYENDVDDANRQDNFNINYSWVVEGSDHSWSAGETKTLYIMAYTGGAVRFYTGGTNTSGYGGVIVEATALPNTIGDGSEP